MRFEVTIGHTSSTETNYLFLCMRVCKSSGDGATTASVCVIDRCFRLKPLHLDCNLGCPNNCGDLLGFVRNVSRDSRT